CGFWLYRALRGHHAKGKLTRRRRDRAGLDTFVAPVSSQKSRDSGPRLTYSRGQILGKKVLGRSVMNRSVQPYTISRREAIAGAAALGAIVGAPAIARAAGPQGQLTWGIHVSLAPAWFDPAE